ncbi:MAG: tetratricopeptide repeat protein [Nanoarchaeota archaeon]|nr:tetratricopeptide repeat protein [Nanoarchaeota archaeon]
MGILKQIWERLNESPNRRQARTLTREAYFLWERGDPLRAGMLLENAIEADPTYSHAHSEYGMINNNFDRDYARAEKHIKIAIELEPNNPKFWNNLAFTYFKKGDLEQALASVTVAGTIDPNYASAYAVKAEIIKAMGKSEEEVQPLVEKARQLYEQTGLRSDGTPLRKGEPENFLAHFKK